MDKRILIVGTSPYDVNTPARAFDSYFHFCKRECLAQVFSSPITPMKGHCGTLFQMTDKDVLYRWMGKEKKTGRIFTYAELSETKYNKTSSKELISNPVINRLYRVGHNKSSMVYLLRGILWRKKYWCTKQFNDWLDDFNPECIFLSFSDDYFIPQIALYVAEKFNIPIVSSIGDDYYFNYKFSLSPLYNLYKLTYRKLIRRVFRNPGSVIYIGNKIKDKYNSEFVLNGETVYLTSSIQRRDFRIIDTKAPKISYFGNIRLGRNESLSDIGEVLREINPSYFLDVYSNEIEKTIIETLINNSNIRLHEAIPYDEVVRITLESDIIVVVEGFKRKDIDISRYSLSTKVADSLASGVNVLAYGSTECGAIEYALETESIAVCTDKSDLKETIQRLIFDASYQKENYEKAKKICETNHTLKNSCSIFEGVIEKVTGEE